MSDKKENKENKAMEFTVEEMNLISIFIMPTRTETIKRLETEWAYPKYSIMHGLFESSARKLNSMTDEEFLQTEFCYSDAEGEEDAGV